MPSKDTGSGSVHEARLELLSTFHAVFTERSVTGAARVLGASQPTVSKHLGKLRTWFQDDLFVRTPQGMEPTEKAEAMALGVTRILKEIDGLARRQQFFPHALRGPYAVALADDIQHFLPSRLLPLLASQAPELRVALQLPTPGEEARALEVGELQCAVLAGGLGADHIRQNFLYKDALVCLMGRNHALASAGLSVERYAAAGHLRVGPPARQAERVDIALAQAQHERFVRLEVPGYAAAGVLLPQSDLVATVPARVAEWLVERHDVVVRPLPVEVPEVPYFLCWHSRWDKDPANSWLRRIIAKCVQPKGVGGGGVWVADS